jgi:hypothetical protein
MTCIAVPYAPHSARPGPAFPGAAIPLREIRCAAIVRQARAALAAALALAILATVVRAEAELQAWIPQVLELPADAEVVTDREIGSSVRMLSVTTAAETGPLLRSWEEALRTGGYNIEQDADELLDNALEFSGPGISAAKIVANRRAENGLTLIEFDATLK